MTASWQLAMITCWHVWKSICQFVFDNKRLNVANVMQEVMNTNVEMSSARVLRQATNYLAADTRWKRLNHGMIKVNCDVAWCASSKQGESE